MTVQATPIVMTKVAEQRCADFLAEADRERLGRLAQPHANRHQQWPDLLAVAAAAVALTLLLAVGSAAAQEPPQRTQPSLVQAEDQPEMTAVQKVREAAP